MGLIYTSVFTSMTIATSITKLTRIRGRHSCPLNHINKFSNNTSEIVRSASDFSSSFTFSPNQSWHPLRKSFSHFFGQGPNTHTHTHSRSLPQNTIIEMDWILRNPCEYNRKSILRGRRRLGFLLLLYCGTISSSIRFLQKIGSDAVAEGWEGCSEDLNSTLSGFCLEEASGDEN